MSRYPKPSKFTNSDVVKLIEDYKQWLLSDDKNMTWSSFCYKHGINHPHYLKDYLFRKFTGLNGRVDFANLWLEAERIREDKLIELGIFSRKVNANFLISVMNSKFNWHNNTIVAGVSVEDIMQAKQRADRLVNLGY